MEVQTITRCFAKAGIANNINLEVEQDPALVLFSDYEEICKQFDWFEPPPMQDFITFDNDLLVHFDAADNPDTIVDYVIQSHILPTVSNTNEETDSDTETDQIIPEETDNTTLTFQQAVSHINELIKYAGANKLPIIDDLLSFQSKLESFHALAIIKSFHQTAVTDYFSKN